MSSRQQLLSTADAARILDLTPNAVRAAAKTGRLRVAQETVGGIRLYRLSDVEEFKQRRERLAAMATR